MGPTKILAIKLRSLGDTVIMTAPLLELAEAFPHAEIHVAITEDWAPALRGLKNIHRIWPYKRQKDKTSQFCSMIQMIRLFRKERYDSVVNFHASSSSALLALASGAPCRSIHFHGHDHHNRFSTVSIPGKGLVKPIIERDMDTIRALGIHAPAGRLPRLFLYPREIQEADRLIEDFGLEQPILGIALGASRPTKSWPIERYVSLAVEWCQKEIGSALVFSGPNESHLKEKFLKLLDDLLFSSFSDPKTRSEIRNRIVSTNTLSIRQLAAVLSRISVLAGNDSGTKHLAIGVDTPTVTLFGPEDPFEWHPYPIERHPYLFIENLPCRGTPKGNQPPWCGLQECSVEEHKCMLLIGVDPVLGKCRKVAKR